MTKAYPGPIDGPHLKGESKYLSSPTWVGDAVPEWYMGAPWGLGGECWYVTAYTQSPDRPDQWGRRRTFAGMDQDEVNRAAQHWLSQGGPTPYPDRVDAPRA